MKDELEPEHGEELEPLPRRPRRRPSGLLVMFEMIGNFVLLNAIVGVLGAFLSAGTHTMGSTASAHLDRESGKPILMELKGCEVLAPEDSGGRED